MEKRTATVSARIPEGLEQQLHAVALARDTTLSDLICSALADLVEVERSRYLKLRPVFEQGQDIPGKPIYPLALSDTDGQ